jgi:hypothetical protein
VVAVPATRVRGVSAVVFVLTAGLLVTLIVAALAGMPPVARLVATAAE